MIISHKNIISPVYALSWLRIMKWNKHQQLKKKNNIKKFASNPKLLKIHVKLHGRVFLELLWHVIWVLTLATEKNLSMASVQVSCDMQEPKKIWWSLDDQINWHGTISLDVLTDNPPQSNIVPHFCSPVLNSRLFLIVWAHNGINGHQNQFRRFTD